MQKRNLAIRLNYIVNFQETAPIFMLYLTKGGLLAGVVQRNLKLQATLCSAVFM
jgi:hypothetical protein